MKIIVNNTCFVNIDDLIGKSIPKFFIIERLDSNFVVIKDVKSIEYIKNREDIIDYFDICNLSMKEVDSLIKKINKDRDNNKRVIIDLLNYKNNKDEFDLKVSNLINNDIFIKTKIYGRVSFLK